MTSLKLESIIVYPYPFLATLGGGALERTQISLLGTTVGSLLGGAADISW